MSVVWLFFVIQLNDSNKWFSALYLLLVFNELFWDKIRKYFSFLDNLKNNKFRLKF